MAITVQDMIDNLATVDPTTPVVATETDFTGTGDFLALDDFHRSLAAQED